MLGEFDKIFSIQTKSIESTSSTPKSNTSLLGLTLRNTRVESNSYTLDPNTYVRRGKTTNKQQLI
jgi:hypothetical protein